MTIGDSPWSPSSPAYLLSYAVTHSRTHGSVRTEANSISHLRCCSIPTIPCGRTLEEGRIFILHDNTFILPPPSARACPNRRQSYESFHSFFCPYRTNEHTRDGMCLCECEVCVWVCVGECVLCVPCRSMDFPMNSNCGDLVNSGARVDTEVLNRLVTFSLSTANQH